MAVVILAVLITLFAYILWKYVKLQNKNNLAEKEDDVSFLEDYYKFQIPVSLRTIQAQAPFLKQELGVTGVTVTAPVSLIDRCFSKTVALLDFLFYSVLFLAIVLRRCLGRFF